MSPYTDMREPEVIALRGEVHRLEMLVEGMAEAAAELARECDELRGYVAASIRREMGRITVDEFLEISELPAVQAEIATTLCKVWFA